MTHTTTITFESVEMEVTCEFTEGVRSMYYDNDGDPGDPGNPASAEIETIEIGGVECTDLLEKHWKGIEEAVIEDYYKN